MEADKKSLSDALEKANLTKLPDKWDGKDVWFRAIALVRKQNMREEYAIYERKISLNTNCDKYSVSDTFNVLIDFGSMSIISEVIEFYPYKFLQEKYIPTDKNRKKIVDRICRAYNEEDKDKIDELSNEDLKSLIYNMAFKLQVEDDIRKSNLNY